MKNIDFKKLLVFIMIIVLIVLLVFAGIKFMGKEELDETSNKKINDVMNEYFSKLTEGYTSTYNGVDYLYAKDKTTAADLELKQILNMAIKYASDHNLDISVSIADLENINKEGIYGDINDYTSYNGEAIREAAKTLFGKELEKTSAISSNGFLYDYYYVPEYDIYLVKRNNVYDLTSNKQKVEYKVISTEKKKDKYITTIAVAYVYKTDNATYYYKDALGKEEISNDSKEFPEDEINKFDKYKFTLSLDDNGNYIFESVEKVK